MSEQTENFWRKCSSCKNRIALGARYFTCSVSTCNGQRTGYVFCSVPCFERHLPGARHKDAAALENTAPTKAGAVSAGVSSTPTITSASEAMRAPQRTIIRPATTSAAAAPKPAIQREVLVIASRLKEYIQARSQYNTSAGVMDVLSDHLRNICDRGIENTRADGRKTVMDRDFDFLKK